MQLCSLAASTGCSIQKDKEHDNKRIKSSNKFQKLTIEKLKAIRGLVDELALSMNSHDIIVELGF